MTNLSLVPEIAQYKGLTFENLVEKILLDASINRWKRTIIALILFVLLTTITTQLNLSISKFNLNKIVIENNSLLEKEDIKKSLASIYGKNLIFLDVSQIKNVLIDNSYIESFNIKKSYPNTLKIKIFEKKPLVILINKKSKFYLSEKFNLIEFKKFQNYNNLPYVYGNKEKFKEFYINLKKIDFPIEIIKKYTLYELNRWI